VTTAIGDRLAFGAAVTVNLVVLLVPSPPDVPSVLPGADKVVHALIFAAVALTGARIGLPWRGLLAVLLAWAVGSELVQHALLPHRGGDAWDVLADALGAVLGRLLVTSNRPSGSR
jgi:VanZ family protein